MKTQAWTVDLVDPKSSGKIGTAKIFAKDEDSRDYALQKLRESELTTSISMGKDDPATSQTITYNIEGLSIADPEDFEISDQSHDLWYPDASSDDGHLKVTDANDADKAADKAVDTVESTEYAQIELTPEVSLIVYEASQNNANKQQPINLHLLRFYFTPLFLILKGEAKYEPIDNNHFVKFPVFLYDETFPKRVVDFVKLREHISIQANRVNVLPINRIDIRERLGSSARLRYIFPETSAPGSTRPILSARHWIYMQLDTEVEAQAFLSRLKAGRASFDITGYFSGRETTTDMAIIRIKQSDKTEMKNLLGGEGEGRHVSRGQQMLVTRQILNTIEQYVYQESAVRNELNSDAVLKLIQDQTFPPKLVDLESYNSQIWEKFSDYGFDKRDIAPDKITKMRTDIRECQTYKQANSRNIGGSAQASFLGFSGSASGSYASQDEYYTQIDKAFELTKEGEWYSPKSIKVTQSLSINVTAETVISSVTNVARKGEGRFVIQREASSAWVFTPPAPPPAPWIELTVGPHLLENLPNSGYTRTVINVRGATAIQALFSKFQMEKNWDYVISLQPNQFTNFCYTGDNPPFYSHGVVGDTMILVTVTDQTNVSSGWKIASVRYRV